MSDENRRKIDECVFRVLEEEPIYFPIDNLYVCRILNEFTRELAEDLENVPNDVKEILWPKVNDAVAKVIRGYSALSKMKLNYKEREVNVKIDDFLTDLPEGAEKLVVLTSLLTQTIFESKYPEGTALLVIKIISESVFSNHEAGVVE